MVRPHIIDKETVDKIVELIKIGVSFDSSARAVGVSPSTLYRLKSAAASFINNDLETLAQFDPDYIEVIEYFVEQSFKAQAEGEAHFARILEQAASEDWRAALKILERRFGWEPTSKVEHIRTAITPTDQKALDVSRMSLAELRELASGADVVDGELNETN